MKEFKGKYGTIYVDGKSVKIGAADDKQLAQYLKRKEAEREKLVEQQNTYISEIIR